MNKFFFFVCAMFSSVSNYILFLVDDGWMIGLILTPFVSKVQFYPVSLPWWGIGSWICIGSEVEGRWGCGMELKSVMV